MSKGETEGAAGRRLRPVEATTRGPVIAIGGAEDKMRARVILSRLVKLSGGLGSRIAVIATASSLGPRALRLYDSVFAELGAARTIGLDPQTRAEADAPAAAGALDDATGVFLTGGNQLRLAQVLTGTALGRAIAAANERGATVAGTSAGASALAGHMMAFGDSGATPRHRMAQVAAGLGLLPGLVIDQHFEQRTRLGRLLAVIAQSPDLLGVGLDEDTAAIVHPDLVMEVLGRGAVTIVDGSKATTDAFLLRGHRPMMVSGAILHTIPAGYRFDLRDRSLVEPAVRPGDRRRKASE